MEQLTDTIDNGEIQSVHIAPIGEFVGSDAEGKPVPEKMTVESLTRLAEKMNASDECLCDIDHASVRPGASKDSQAAGWFRRFVVDPIKGLFATLSLTRKGKELLENREYRYVSPTFILDGNGEPIDLHSVSLTNVPAFKDHISPIINSEATAAEPNKEIINMEMTKEELVDLIKSTVAAMNAEAEEEKKEEANTETCNECGDTEEKVDNACSDEKPAEEVKNEEAPAEEEKPEEEKPEEEKPEEEEEKKDEVIKLEALNSAPVVGTDVTGKAAWENLHGDAFWKYLREHPEVR